MRAAGLALGLLRFMFSSLQLYSFFHFRFDVFLLFVHPSASVVTEVASYFTFRYSLFPIRIASVL